MRCLMGMPSWPIGTLSSTWPTRASLESLESMVAIQLNCIDSFDKRCGDDFCKRQADPEQ
jgi:hypothetical protein